MGSRGKRSRRATSGHATSGLALSERCRTPRELAKALLGGMPPPDLARHLASCPACRKVLADTLRAQAFPIEYYTPDARTVAWARAKAAGPMSGEIRFRIRLTDPVEAEGPESAVVLLPPKAGGVTRIRTRGLGHPAEILLEPLSPGRILLRYRAAPAGTVVTLEREGRSVGKGRKGDAFWRDLGPGAYAIVLHSAAAPRALHLLLVPR